MYLAPLKEGGISPYFHVDCYEKVKIGTIEYLA
jgi:hypothetical protein